MTNKELAQKLRDVALNHKTLYVMGCFGAPMTAANKARYKKNHNYNTDPDRQAMIDAATEDTFGFDCVCLIKGILWGWCGDKTKICGGATYKANGVPDIGADTMITKCSDLSTDFSKIEVGEAVWMKGHIGVYIGDGLAVECTPKWENDVQITACNCTKSGYNRRNWTKHGKLPYVTYVAEEVKPEIKPEVKPEVKPTAPKTLKVGDIVTFKGNTHYASSNSTKAVSCRGGKAKITQIYNGKHPYHLVRVGSDNATVYGWVDAADIEEITPTEEWTPKVGDIVQYNGTTHYTSANSTSPKSCRGGKAKITRIYKLGQSKHPYHLIRVSGGGATVYGWVDDGSFTKA